MTLLVFQPYRSLPFDFIDFSEFLPLLDRPKQGFGVPIDSWLRGPLRQWATDMLAPDRLKREGFFSPEPVQRRLREHLAGTRNWQYHLWAVLMFESWLEQARAAAREPAGVAG